MKPKETRSFTLETIDSENEIKNEEISPVTPVHCIVEIVRPFEHGLRPSTRTNFRYKLLNHRKSTLFILSVLFVTSVVALVVLVHFFRRFPP